MSVTLIFKINFLVIFIFITGCSQKDESVLKEVGEKDTLNLFSVIVESMGQPSESIDEFYMLLENDGMVKIPSRKGNLITNKECEDVIATVFKSKSVEYVGHSRPEFFSYQLLGGNHVLTIEVDFFNKDKFYTISRNKDFVFLDIEKKKIEIKLLDKL